MTTNTDSTPGSLGALVMATPLDNYDGVPISDVHDDLMLYSDRGVEPAPEDWPTRPSDVHMGRVYALRHTDPGRVVLAVDMDYCGTLTQLRVIECEQVKIPLTASTDDAVCAAVDAELDRLGWY